MACADCRTPVRCANCHGPLALSSAAGTATCRWCGRAAAGYTCPACGGRRLRASVVGARRTAEELGRAFPGVPVRTSGRDEVLATVADEPAVVVSTPGAEPVGRYGMRIVWGDDHDTVIIKLPGPVEVTDFWTGQSLGRQKGTLTIPDMAPHSPSARPPAPA